MDTPKHRLRFKIPQTPVKVKTCFGPTPPKTTTPLETRPNIPSSTLHDQQHNMHHSNRISKKHLYQPTPSSTSNQKKKRPRCSINDEFDRMQTEMMGSKHLSPGSRSDVSNFSTPSFRTQTEYTSQSKDLYPIYNSSIFNASSQLTVSDISDTLLMNACTSSQSGIENDIVNPSSIVSSPAFSKKGLGPMVDASLSNPFWDPFMQNSGGR